MLLFSVRNHLGNLASFAHHAYNIDKKGCRMRFKELERILNRNGWYVQRINGSHYQYKKIGIHKTLTVPKHPGDIPNIIVKNILKEIDSKD